MTRNVSVALRTSGTTAGAALVSPPRPGLSGSRARRSARRRTAGPARATTRSAGASRRVAGIPTKPIGWPVTTGAPAARRVAQAHGDVVGALVGRHDEGVARRAPRQPVPAGHRLDDGPPHRPPRPPGGGHGGGGGGRGRRDGRGPGGGGPRRRA